MTTKGHNVWNNSSRSIMSSKIHKIEWLFPVPSESKWKFMPRYLYYPQKYSVWKSPSESTQGTFLQPKMREEQTLTLSAPGTWGKCITTQQLKTEKRPFWTDWCGTESFSQNTGNFLFANRCWLFSSPPPVHLFHCRSRKLLINDAWQFKSVFRSALDEGS